LYHFIIFPLAVDLCFGIDDIDAFANFGIGNVADMQLGRLAVENKFVY